MRANIYMNTINVVKCRGNLSSKMLNDLIYKTLMIYCKTHVCNTPSVVDDL